MAQRTSSSLPVRKWGPGTAAIARALIAAKSADDAGCAGQGGWSVPTARLAGAQALRRCARGHRRSPGGYRGRPARLLELYRDRARPHLAAPETFWFSTRPLIDQAHRITEIARRAEVAVAFSADLGPDLLAPWRHPTSGDRLCRPRSRRWTPPVSYPPKAGRTQPSSGDIQATPRSWQLPNPGHVIVDHVPLTDPVQQWWDLHDFGGEDRREAADRLRRAIIEKSIASAA